MTRSARKADDPYAVAESKVAAKITGIDADELMLDTRQQASIARDPQVSNHDGQTPKVALTDR